MRIPTWLLVCALCPFSSGVASPEPGFYRWAERPPMGWNSWDCFATTVTEDMTKRHADIMAEKLLPFGWEYIVVDIQWYEPSATGFEYRAGAKLVTDEFGRLLPAVNKFPSAEGGRGFSALAEYVHSKGLKFGIHLMRGIPRQVVDQNLPIKGTKYRAADIADKVNVCEWNKDMYGIDMSKPGAQEYYDSVFELIASWGVDYIKVDDLARPYVRNQPETEAIRKAIDRTGRPMVLSISPGETDIRAAAHVIQHSNLWRISDDFWDHWSLLESQFERLHAWTPWRRNGAWPDADMIPFGTIDMGRKTYFTPQEQRTLMTLWCIARSPLMLGADLTKLDQDTLALITNDEVLKVNRESANNRQLFRDNSGRAGWIADVPNSEDKYVALFNTRDPWILKDENRIWRSAPVTMDTPKQEIEFEVSVDGAHTVVLRSEDGETGRFWWPSLWRSLRWEMADGTEVKVDREYGSHGEKVNGLSAPAGARKLRGTARLDDAARQRKKGEQMVFSVYLYRAAEVAQTTQAVSASLSEVGLGQTVRVRDLWSNRDLGVVTGELRADIEWHSAQLYRLSRVSE